MARLKRTHRSTSDNTYELRIQAALNGLAQGTFPSIAKAAEEHNVSRQTLSDRAKGIHKSRKESYERRRLLSNSEENVLLSWCDHTAITAKPMDPATLRGRALSIKGVYPGKHWHRRFIKRHPELKLGKASGLDPNRAHNFNEPTMKHYFQLRQEVEEKYDGIPPEHQWNMDEKGIQLGGGRKNNGRKFIFTRRQKERYRIKSDNLELVTIIECVSAAGVAMPPSFVLKDGPKPDTRRLLDESVSSIAFSPNGWTDREICERWFTDQFVPFAMSKRVCDKPIFLNYDGHDSHETFDMQRVAFENNVILIAFPSKTTHKTQPLDVSVFSAVQDRWSYHCDKRVAEGISMNRYNIIHEYLQVRHVITPELIQAAFRKTGIYPLNPSIFTADDFAPSKSFSVIAHVPASFPDEVPTSPPAYLSEIDDTTDSEYAPFDSDDTPSCNDVPMDHHSPTSNGNSDDDLEAVPCLSSVETMSPLPDSHFCDWDDSNGDSDDDLEAVPCLSSVETMSPLPDSHFCDWDEPLDFINDPFSLAFDSSLDDPFTGPSEHSHNVIHTPITPNNGLSDNRFTVTPASTRTTRSSFTPIKILPALQYLPIHDDEKKSHDELVQEVRRLRNQVNGLSMSLSMQTAELRASNAHCTVIRRELGDVRIQLENIRAKKSRGSTKIKGRVLTLPEMRAAFDAEDKERQEKERVEREKEVQKAADALSRSAQVAQDIVSKVFDKPLTTYKKRDDVDALAGALSISNTGTIPEVTTRIKDHLASHPELKTSDRFAGLYQEGRRRAAILAPLTNSAEISQAHPSTPQQTWLNTSHTGDFSQNMSPVPPTSSQTRPRPRPIAKPRLELPQVPRVSMLPPAQLTSYFLPQSNDTF